jgi:hypothetical protein
MPRIVSFAVLLGLLTLAGRAWSAADEIQVYTDDLQEPGKAGLELHTNYVFRGRAVPDYAGERAPDDVLRLTGEFSFGVNDHWDWGFYVPLAWDRRGSSLDADGVKLRVKWLQRPGKGVDGWFYGENLEIGFNSYRTAPAHWDAEFRTIVGVSRGPWQVTVNPIFGIPLSRSRDGGGMDFEIDLKIARNISAEWSVGLEHYAGLGPVRDASFGGDSDQTTFLAVDRIGRHWDLNFGIGRGWTDPTDRFLIKAILGVGF